MIFRIFALLCITRSCLAVTVIINETEVDCNGHCACCEGGEAQCGRADGKPDYCLNGCVNTIFGHRCKSACPGNCRTCAQDDGHPCFTCKNSFYDIISACSMRCPLGCDGTCNDNGICSACKSNFEGARCDTCIPGKYGEDCSMTCHYQNCRCTDLNGCDSCTTGFAGDFCMKCVTGYYGANCNIRCLSGCRDENCMRNGKCIECITGYYGEQCNDMCSTGCRGGVCFRNGTCDCTDNFTGTRCDECVVGKYGEICQQECSAGCSTLSCGKDDGSCHGGCDDGLYGIYCSRKCNDIGNECFKCSQPDGRCLVCKAGFYTNENGNCISCNSNCKDDKCNAETGKCINGCAVSYWGDQCNLKCNSNCASCQQDAGICYSCNNHTVHGLYCSEPCVSACFERQCEQRTGHCLLGCNGDFFGNMCQTSCPEHCQHTGTKAICNNEGDCLNGCIHDFEGRHCTDEFTLLHPQILHSQHHWVFWALCLFVHWLVATCGTDACLDQ
ncbi:multiple epidermal growth factor-like domains protein 10 isoform X2 [Mya arenaria]|uniref:multiple epidermal growth factor-like domains protein 10 isoform X2 n=1 Tax=Mya arenaria TaxID=6604 RepID=UPI0022E01302|nr:multiple epidermal growth factor-like domains protein 10 isoform X2 [Mya arenaria]